MLIFVSSHNQWLGALRPPHHRIPLPNVVAAPISSHRHLLLEDLALQFFQLELRLQLTEGKVPTLSGLTSWCGRRVRSSTATGGQPQYHHQVATSSSSSAFVPGPGTSLPSPRNKRPTTTPRTPRATQESRILRAWIRPEDRPPFARGGGPTRRGLAPQGESDGLVHRTARIDPVPRAEGPRPPSSPAWKAALVHDPVPPLRSEFRRARPRVDGEIPL